MRLSICSSVYFNEPYLNLNKRLLDLHNVQVEWLVVDNTALAGKKRLSNERLAPGFRILDGIRQESLTLGDGCTSIGQLHHGASLNECVRNADNPDFLLLLDPDFYMFGPIYNILFYMLCNNTPLFGSPYMSSSPLIRNFPVAFNLFVNVRQIPLSSLDFTPGYGDYHNEGVYPDCGYKVYAKHLAAGTEYEATKPSAPEGADYHHTQKSLSHFGIEYDNEPNEKGTKIDEYFWLERPYAMHVRSKLSQDRNFKLSRVTSQLNIVENVFKAVRGTLQPWC